MSCLCGMKNDIIMELYLMYFSGLKIHGFILNNIAIYGYSLFMVKIFFNHSDSICSLNLQGGIFDGY